MLSHRSEAMNELTTWGYHWSESGGVSWNEYLRQRDIVRAINGGSAMAANGLVRCMASNTRKVIGSVQSLERTLESSVSRAADQISGTFTWGFGEMLASLGGIQTTLDELLKVAKTPAQTAAYEQFEIARDAFRKGLYPECLDALSQAINGSGGVSAGYKLEWRFHHLRGLVLLGSHDHVDSALVNPADAEQSFLMAARYAKTDQPKDAAKAFLSAGWAAYVQVDRAHSGKLRDALEHTQKARELDPGLGEAIFQEAKFQIALGQIGPAFEALKEASGREAVYVAKAAADGDFRRYQQHLDRFLEDLFQWKLREVRRDVEVGMLQAWKHQVEAGKCWFHANSNFDSNPIVQKLLEVDKSIEVMSLIELLDYHPRQFEKDQKKLKSLIFVICANISEQVEQTEIEMVPTGEIDRIQVRKRESYFEDVIKPGGWFRKEVRTRVKKTRTKTVFEDVPRMQAVEKKVFRLGPEKVEWSFIDGLGEPIVEGELRNGLLVPFVCLQPGEFIMGSPEMEPGRENGDELQHRVTLSRPFALAQTPCTQAQWEAVMGGNPSKFKGPDRPVEQVSWFDAMEFCNRLTAKYRAEWVLPEGLEWRLPTEAEWEYAARAGTMGARYGELEDTVWYSGNSGKETHPVKQKAPNAWGLYDMLGNVWEWCSDWCADYTTDSVTDPTGPSSGKGRSRRGGSWVSGARSARASNRSLAEPGHRSDNMGFRPVIGIVL